VGFNDIFPAIQRMDADVLTIESSKSDLKLFGAFERHGYANAIGPGLYDIHSPRVPSVEEMAARLQAMPAYLPARPPVGEPRLRPQDPWLERVAGGPQEHGWTLPSASGPWRRIHDEA